MQSKQKARSETRLMKLEKIGFQIQAEQLRKEYSRKNAFNQITHNNGQKARSHSRVALRKIGNFLEPTKIIAVSASKWAIYDLYTSKYIRGFRSHDTHDLNVFSKTLVFCTVNTLISKHKIDMSRFETIVTAGVLKMYPHECKLKEDDIMSLQDLLCLMVMEESEVYELILSVNIGTYLMKKSKKEYFSVFDVKDEFMKEHLSHFYDCVNRYAKLLQLEKIKYFEVQIHKLISTCSASDIALLSIQCLKIPLFLDIIRKDSHTLSIKCVDSEGNLQTKQQTIKNKAVVNPFIRYANVCRNWQQNSFMASHCSIFYEDPRLRPVVVVLLGSYGTQDREKDIQQIVEWYIKNGETIEKEKHSQEVKEEQRTRLYSQGNANGKEGVKSSENAYLKTLQKKLQVPESQSPLAKKYSIKPLRLAPLK